MNSWMMRRSSLSPQMNCGLPPCLASELVYQIPPPPALPDIIFHCLTFKKNKVFGVLRYKESIFHNFVSDPFVNVELYLCIPSTGAVWLQCFVWWLGFRNCHWTPPLAPPPLRLLALSMRMAPFPRHRSAGTAFTANIVRMEIDREWGKEKR